MKIVLPVQCQDVELNEREWIFCSLMFLVSRRLNDKDWGQYRYQFYKRDLSRILGSYSSPSQFNNLRKIFKIGILNSVGVSVEWLQPVQIRNHAMPMFYDEELTDHKAIQVYAYLLGVFSNETTQIFGRDTRMYTNYPQPHDFKINEILLDSFTLND